MAKKRVIKKRRYNQKSLYLEREYGFYWYAWLWNLTRPLLIFLCSAVIVVGLLMSGWNYIYGTFLKPMNPDDPSTVTFDIDQDSSVSTIADNLVSKQLLRNKGVFKYTIMFQGLTNKIHYGSYQVSPSMNVNDIISVLTSGSASTERTITVIPGWTVEDIANYFVKIGALTDTKEFLNLCNDTVLFENYYPIQQAIAANSIAGRKYVLEGYLAPDTYRVFTNASAEQLIRTMLDQTDVVLNGLYNTASGDDSAAPDNGLTREQTIVLASMIEKEAAVKDDFARVSAVFHNRIKGGMRLESDPTVKYTLNTRNYVLTAEQLNTKTPYNTYAMDGLPLGPICNPSKAALEAALHPDQTYMDEGYLYFCSKGPDAGDLEFSKTLDQHQAAVAKYRPLWEAYDRQQSSPSAAPADTAGTQAP